MTLKTIILTHPLMVEKVHYEAGEILDLDEVLAKRIVDAKHARLFARTDAHGSGTIAVEDPATDEGQEPAEGQTVELAVVRKSPRKAARVNAPE